MKTYQNSEGKTACAQCGAVDPSADLSAPCKVCAQNESDRQERLSKQRATAAILAKSIVDFKSIETAKGWRFEATLDNGETFVVRQLATRPYTKAAIHDLGVVSKFDMLDPRSFITLHQAAPKPAGNWDNILLVVNINSGGAQ